MNHLIRIFFLILFLVLAGCREKIQLETVSQQTLDDTVPYIAPTNARGCGHTEPLSDEDKKLLSARLLSVNANADPIMLEPKDLPFIMEGMVRPEISKMVLTRNYGPRDSNSNFTKSKKFPIPYNPGDTHWCITLNQKDDSIGLGNNQYSIQAYAKDGQGTSKFISYFVESYLGVITTSEKLSVLWEDESHMVDDFTAIKESIPEDYRANFYVGSTHSFYKVGVINGGLYNNLDLLLMVNEYGMGGEYALRVIHDPLQKRLILIEKESDVESLIAFDRELKNIFYSAQNLVIPNLHIADTFRLPGVSADLVMSNPRINASPLLINTVSPEKGESQLEAFNRRYALLATVPKIGKVYEERFYNHRFFVTLPDATYSVYDFIYPGKKSAKSWCAYVCNQGYDFSLNLISGKHFTGTYINSGFNAPIADNEKIDAMIKGAIVKIGTLDGDPIYVPKNRDGQLYTDNWMLRHDLTEANFDRYPLILWQDPLGRWIQWVNLDFTKPQL